MPQKSTRSPGPIRSGTRRPAAARSAARSGLAGRRRGMVPARGDTISSHSGEVPCVRPHSSCLACLSLGAAACSITSSPSSARSPSRCGGTRRPARRPSVCRPGTCRRSGNVASGCRASRPGTRPVPGAAATSSAMRPREAGSCIAPPRTGRSFRCARSTSAGRAWWSTCGSTTRKRAPWSAAAGRDAFDDHHVGDGAGLTQGLGRGVFRRVPPRRACSHGGELENDEPLRLPGAGAAFYLPATHEVPSAVLDHGGRAHPGVFLVPLGVEDFHAQHDIPGHCSLPWLAADPRPMLSRSVAGPARVTAPCSGRGRTAQAPAESGSTG